MVVVLAKLSTPEVVGQFTLGFAVTAPVILLASFALRPVQATDTSHQYIFSDYLGLRLVMTPIALLAIAITVYVTGYRWETSIVILVIGVAKSFESISDVFYGLFQQHERMDLIAKSMMIKGLLSLVALTIGIYLTGSVLCGTLALAIIWAWTLVRYDIHNGMVVLAGEPASQPQYATVGLLGNAAIVRPCWKFKTLAGLARIALPLGVTMTLMSLNTNIPRYFIERYWGEKALGIFAAMAYLMIVGGRAMNALGQSATPRLARYFAESNGEEFRALLLRMVGFGVLLGGAGILMALAMGREILTLFYRPEYAEHVNVLFWLMLAAALEYVSFFLSYGVMACRFFRVLSLLFLLTTAIIIICSYVFIPSHGLIGAAWACCAGALVQIVGALLFHVYALIGMERRCTSRQS